MMSWIVYYLPVLTLAGLPVVTAVPRRVMAQATPVASSYAPPVVNFSSSAIHTPFNGTPTVTGALNASSIGTGVPTLGALPAATTYPSDGNLHQPAPAPYVPGGGLGTGGNAPVYNAKSDFDYESLVCRTPSPKSGILC